MTADPQLATRLEELAETPAPPMDIDVEHARRLGQRRLYTRRATLVAGVGLAAGAATLAAPAVLRRDPAPVTSVPTDPRSGNPMIAYAEFGWLPDSITRVEYGKGLHGDYVHAVNETADLGTHLWVAVHPPGDVPTLSSWPDRPQHRVPAPPVNGRTAYWITENESDRLNGGDAYLVWQAADRSWARLHGYYLGFFRDPQAVLHRVASEVTVAERPLPLPLRFDPPAGLHVAEATFYRPMPRHTGTGAWQLLLACAVNALTFTIVAHPEGTATRRKEEAVPPTKTAKGMDVCLPLGNHGPDWLDALGGAQAILDRITPLGIDEREWTLRPFD
jgi:hypothetical protein